ncbi:MAG TPA: hypothetical protein PKK06_16675 [Phycisphaerae bacterium]|nr:hypothetical protein [Phycisphaerae bacterium]HNU46924.1 hypothetical protein [Phycisphaerae bacterium]
MGHSSIDVEAGFCAAADLRCVGRDRLRTGTVRRLAARPEWAWGLVVVALVVTIVLVHRLNPRSLIGFHGMPHAGIVFSALEGDLPPANPLAYGLPTPYYWGYHVLLAGIVRLSGGTPIGTMEVVQLAALALLVGLVASLGRRLLGGGRAGILACAIALVGVNPLGPFLLAGRVLDGSVSLGIGDFARSPCHPMLRAMDPFFDIRWGGNLFFFFNCGSRGIALALAVVAAYIVCHSLAPVSRLRCAAAAAAVAGACALQPIVGVAAGAGLGAGLLAVAGPWRRRDLPALPAAAYLLVSLLAGALLALPTYAHLLDGHSVGLPLETHPYGLLTKSLRIAVIAVIPVTLTLLAHRRGRLEHPHLRVLAFGGLLLLAGSCLAHLPGGREHSVFNTAICFLALPSAAALTPPLPGSGAPSVCPSRRWQRFGRGLVLAPMAAVTAVTVGAFIYRQPVRLAWDGLLVRDTRDVDKLETYRWLSTQTPSNALVLFDVRDGEQTAFYGGESEIPAMTRRYLYVDVPGIMMMPDDQRVEQRYATTAAIFDGKPLSEQQLRDVRALGRPMFALCRTPDDDAALESTSSPRLFRAGRYTVYRVAFPAS